MPWMLGGNGRGYDGADAPSTKLTPTKAQGQPVNVTASSRCDQCGTGDAYAGRPGGRITKFRCRSCGHESDMINYGIGFTYQSPN